MASPSLPTNASSNPTHEPAHPHVSTLIPVMALVAITAVWGSSFVIIHDLVERIPPIDFLGVRFGIAGALIGLMRWRALREVPRYVWSRGIILGGVFACAQYAQTVGLAHTNASIAGFITGMYVVLTPVVLLVAFRVRVPAITWLAIAVATLGMAVLKLDAWSVGYGETITLLAALLYAVHIVLLGQWSTPTNQVELTTIQMMTLGAVFIIGALPDGVALPSGVSEWAQMIYMALIAGLLALAVQTWAQSRISAAKTAIILTGEPVFAAIFAVLFGGEIVTARMVGGGLLIVGAMLTTELYPLLRPRPTQQEIPVEPAKLSGKASS